MYVACYRHNYAGLRATARSQPTVVDVTAPQPGWVHDVFTVDDEDDDADVDAGVEASFDADYGDAATGAVEARWGSWFDAESGIVGYEWAVMVIDPRQANPIDAARPGELLRSAVQAFLAANGRDLTLPPRHYGTGQATRLFEADNGLMYTDWLPVAGNATSAFRGDVDIVSGATYVALVRATNGAGLTAIAASDGIIFDRSDPCMGRPHAGLDRFVVPRYLATEGEVSAVWGANLDPLHLKATPFECMGVDAGLVASDADAIPAGEIEGSQTVGEQGVDNSIQDVAVVPLSHMEWELRRLIPQGNLSSPDTGNLTILEAGLQAGYDEDLLPVNNETSQVNVTIDVNATGDTVDDTPIPDINNATTTVVVTPNTQAGPRYASAHSGCCSSYSELNPMVLHNEWDWRPISPLARFGSGVAVASGRFVAVGGAAGVSLFDTAAPDSEQHSITAQELADSAGVAAGSGDDLVHVAADRLVVAVTARALGVLTTPLAHGVPLSDPASSTTPMLSPVLESALGPGHSTFSVTLPGGDVFAGTSFRGVAATLGDLVAVTIEGVIGASAGRGVGVLRRADNGSLALVGVVTSVSPSFGETLSLSRVQTTNSSSSSLAADVVLSIGMPQLCAAGATVSLDWADDCTGATNASSVALYTVGASTVTPRGSLQGVEAAVAPSGGFGTALAASGPLVVVGDAAAALGRGQVSVFKVAHGGAAAAAAEFVCAVPGSVSGGGFGFSVDVVSAEDDGHGGSRNAGTALVVVGVPGANMASVIRVNVTAHDRSDGDAVTAADVCQVVAVFRQRGLDAVTTTASNGTVVTIPPPLFGAGAAVGIGGGMVVFTSPLVRTWPTQASHGADVDVAAMAGTGRVFGSTFCWSGDVRRPQVASQGAVPSTCRACSDVNGAHTWSAGGAASMCEDCADRECRARDNSDEAYFFTARDSNVTLENGAEYEIDVTAVSWSGRRNTQTTPPFRMDWTPPEVGLVQDAFVGNQSTCLYCHDDIDVNTNATYLSVTWCCGWQDLQSSIVLYRVAFGSDVAGATDILDWTDVGLAESHTVWNLDLVTGTRYFACVVAVNAAGLFSDVVCSDGVVYDDTPPSMLFVRDGLLRGADVDSQSFLNLAFTTYEGQDNETDIVDYVFSLGTSPGAMDMLAEESGGNATLNGVVDRAFLSPPVVGQTMYVNIRAVNLVGLSSELLSSDGVAIGKAEVTMNKAQATTLALDTQVATKKTNTGSGGGTTTPAEPEKTLAAVQIPAGAVSQQATTFIGGAVTEDDVAKGLAVNASKTAPPKNNFKFGDYSYVCGGVEDPCACLGC